MHEVREEQKEEVEGAEGRRPGEAEAAGTQQKEEEQQQGHIRRSSRTTSEGEEGAVGTQLGEVEGGPVKLQFGSASGWK